MEHYLLFIESKYTPFQFTAEFAGNWVQVLSVTSAGELIFAQRDAEISKRGRKVALEYAQKVYCCQIAFLLI